MPRQEILLQASGLCCPMGRMTEKLTIAEQVARIVADYESIQKIGLCLGWLGLDYTEAEVDEIERRVRAAFAERVKEQKPKW